MKCPKCQYIGFEQGDRCRNCGYDFSLSIDLAELDLPIKTGEEPLGPLSDFTLIESSDPEPSLEQPVALQPPTPPAQRMSELPLFGDRGLDDDRPLVSLPAAPRAPMSVRKSAAARQADRPMADEPVLDLAASPAMASPSRRHHPREEMASAEPTSTEVDAAPALARLGGAAIDLLLLSAIDVTVIYLTLRLCDLQFADVRQLPLVPLAAFLAMLNGGYMAAFTAAGGQSIGKMAAGTRVVSADAGGGRLGVPLGQSIVRSAAYAVSVLPAGLGFLPALFASDGRALHDRLAQTRVVKA